MKENIFMVINLILVLLCFVCCIEIQGNIKKEAEVRSAYFAVLNEKIERQTHVVEIAEQHCDDIARCLVNGEW